MGAARLRRLYESTLGCLLCRSGEQSHAPVAPRLCACALNYSTTGAPWRTTTVGHRRNAPSDIVVGMSSSTALMVGMCVWYTGAVATAVHAGDLGMSRQLTLRGAARISAESWARYLLAPERPKRKVKKPVVVPTDVAQQRPAAPQPQTSK